MKTILPFLFCVLTFSALAQTSPVYKSTATATANQITGNIIVGSGKSISVTGTGTVTATALSGAIAGDQTFTGNVTSNGTQGFIGVNLTLGTGGASVRSALGGRGTAQSLWFDGTAGPPVTQPAFGTGPFTLASWVRVDSLAAARPLVSGASGNFYVYLTTDGLATINKLPSGIVRATTAVPLGKWALCVYTRSSSTGTWYVNGLAAGTDTDASDYTTAINQVGGSGFFGTYMNGYLRPLVFNRALTAAEVLAIYETGAPAAGDYHSQGTSAWLNEAIGGTALGYGTADTTSFAINNTSGSTVFLNLYSATRTTKTGQRFNFNVTLSTMTGGTATARWYNNDSNAVNLAAGANVATLTLTGGHVSASQGPFISIPAGVEVVGTYTVDPLGLLLAPESNASGFGYQLKDASGNKAHITLAATGNSWALPTVTGTNSVTAVLTWSATHEAKSLLGQIALPAKAVITSIVTEATAGSSGSGLTVGSVTTPNLFVAANAYTTARKVHTLAAQLPAGTATNDLSLVLDPDTANYTGTINVAVNYIITP